MKGNILLKSLMVLTIMGVNQSGISTKISSPEWGCSAFSTMLEAQDCQGIGPFQNFDVVGDAIEGIQKVLREERHKPYFIRRTYDISQNQVSVTTKSHYAQYRKKPKYEKEIFNADTFSLLTDGSAKIEFVYKSSDKKHITQINKRVKNGGFKTKKIAFNLNSGQEQKGIIKI